MEILCIENKRLRNLQSIKGFCLDRIIDLINMNRRLPSFNKERVTQDCEEKRYQQRFHTYSDVIYM